MMPPSGAHLEWEGGGYAHLVSVNREAVTLLSTVPSPPGSRISGTLLPSPASVVRMKVHVCRAEPDGRFRLEGRALDLTRDLRARLEGLLALPRLP